MQGPGWGEVSLRPTRCLGNPPPTQCGGWEHHPRFEAGRTEAQRGNGTCLRPQSTAGRAGVKNLGQPDAKRAVANPPNPTRSEAYPSLPLGLLYPPYAPPLGQLPSPAPAPSPH